ncbi:molybdenum ABC transporter periplasmic molybdate-binding protein [Mycolicibacterium farcinogenes]|uniref:Molybdenum ABC transporter periplasmic molybdate-binding protein n=1 Tax=Mycolicibacterium senegalense TaxID=1796 RepID=A0A378SWM7_9MYCO|nr:MULTISPECIES: molybdate ABC transporter substrate-binding protein [Mycolicibacterium]MCV7338956.1 molybdate ABC transporter substrate-binding protein [Mycolicibacterium senegalense]MDR7292067.1 molybdate transport system substrate-binding protein [Mycolicibacterium senegalense]QZA23478.1 molybdate ABC transporter substrate-binding protein [Mycolicibacterium senegalense]CDP89542.1 molybdenum ABC transporter periplasmic molybdate-binding protein [Mycolicibacterium farcinogenes]STZ52932.1 moly
MNRVRTLALALSVVAATALIAGCDSAGSTTAEGESITVFAAASLKSAFTEIGEQFETNNPGSSVEFSFAGSSDLVTQLTQGADADVFASADVRNMDRAVAAGLVEGAPVDFASNTLTIVVAPGNPKGIKSFADLTKPGVSVVVCAPPVPCGGATEKVEKATGVTLAPVSEETSVTDVLGKVTSGQADAGLVYLTDAAGAKDKVASVAVPEAAQAVNTYPIAVLKDSGHAQLAQRFVELVTGEAGQKALAKAGFAKP